MMVAIEVVAALIALFAFLPAVQFTRNLRRYRAPRFGAVDGVRVAVLIAARDEEQHIRWCLEHLLASRDVALEVLVLNDDSADKTTWIVQAMAAHDPRLKLIPSEPLPQGWNHRQHACWQLAQATDAPVMLFMDAHVRLEPWALARTVAAMQRKPMVKLLSGFPRLIALRGMEKLLLPLIHFVLLSYLPLGRMRKTTKPKYAAGSGQFLMVNREAYFACGGHAAIRDTRYDGLRLPRLFREHGMHTDLYDLTTLASVRLYDSARAVVIGLAKNASEGLGAPRRVLPISLLLFVGQVLPLFAVVAWALFCASVLVAGATFDNVSLAIAVTATVMLAVVSGLVPRLVAAKRFRQSKMSAWVHPLGVMVLLLIQAYGWVREKLGRPVGWRARQYSSTADEDVVKEFVH